MDAPKCKLCGQRHWGMCPSAASAAQKTEAARKKPERRAPEPPAAHEAPPASTSTPRVKRWREKNRERYNETMRDYRARKKEQK